MTLQNSEIGKYYRVTGLEMEGNLLQRLQALGLTVGTEIKVQNRKKDGALIFKVRGTRLAIGKRIARQIEIEEAVEGG
ncbi:MAG: FeoA family protein, partial [Acetivibrio ethanolgignens]